MQSTNDLDQGLQDRPIVAIRPEVDSQRPRVASQDIPGCGGGSPNCDYYRRLVTFDVRLQR